MPLQDITNTYQPRTHHRKGYPTGIFKLPKPAHTKRSAVKSPQVSQAPSQRHHIPAQKSTPRKRVQVQPVSATAAGSPNQYQSRPSSSPSNQQPLNAVPRQQQYVGGGGGSAGTFYKLDDGLNMPYGTRQQENVYPQSSPPEETQPEFDFDPPPESERQITPAPIPEQQCVQASRQERQITQSPIPEPQIVQAPISPPVIYWGQERMDALIAAVDELAGHLPQNMRLDTVLNSLPALRDCLVEHNPTLFGRELIVPTLREAVAIVKAFSAKMIPVTAIPAAESSTLVPGSRSSDAAAESPAVSKRKHPDTEEISSAAKRSHTSQSKEGLDAVACCLNFANNAMKKVIRKSLFSVLGSISKKGLLSNEDFAEVVFQCFENDEFERKMIALCALDNETVMANAIKKIVRLSLVKEHREVSKAQNERRV